jgi:hypothetical protein
MTPRVLFAVSIDTEEDNWHPTREGLTVENIRDLGRLVETGRGLGIKPTFFATYAVVSRPWAFDAVRAAADALGGEVGAHLHPWNTPPHDGDDHTAGTMLSNFAPACQEAKLRALTEQFAAGMNGDRPWVFRAGRFGLGRETVRVLLANGYRVDSSVTPFFSWEGCDRGPSFVGAPLGVYQLDGSGDVRTPVPGGELTEVPLSAGYTRFSPSKWLTLARKLERPGSRRVRLAGLGARLGIVRRVILSPETNSVRQMAALARRLMQFGVPFLHLFFHSTSLRPGLSPFTRSAADVGRMLDRLSALVDRLAGEVDLQPARVTEVADLVRPA